MNALALLVLLLLLTLLTLLLLLLLLLLCLLFATCCCHSHSHSRVDACSIFTSVLALFSSMAQLNALALLVLLLTASLPTASAF